VVGQVGVEGHRVPLVQVVLGAVAPERDGAARDDHRLARAGLVHRRVPGRARARAGGERVLGHLGALSGQRRGEDLVGVAVAALRPALVAADDAHRALLVEPQQLGEPQVQPARDPPGDLERRARLPPLDLAEHRGGHARAGRQLAQGEVHRLAQGADAGPQGGDGRVVSGDGHQSRVRYRVQLAAATRAAVGTFASTMAAPVTALPDVLVLGAGGTLGIAWLRGVVEGLEEASGLDLRRCEYFVGTSAGSYVAATLASGHGVRDAAADPGRSPDAAASLPTAAAADDGDGAGAGPSGGDGDPGPVRRIVEEGARLAAAVTAPFVPLALSATRPGGAAVRAAALRVAPRPRRAPVDLRRHVRALGARFDGRLRVAAVDRRRGTRVVFGEPGAPPATVADAVLASCSVPWIFAPVEIGGREYVDGGVWSLSNLDVAPAGRGAEVLALLPVLGRHGGHGPLGLARAAGQAAALAEAQVLRARGVAARIVAPDAGVVEAMGPDLMNARRRGPVHDAGFRQGLRLGGAG